jgi:hypothetical protein
MTTTSVLHEGDELLTDELQEAARVIRTRVGGALRELAEAGRVLACVREAHSRVFLRFVRESCGISPAQAYRCLDAYQLLTNFPSLENLPVQTDAARLLAQRGTPSEVIEAVVTGRLPATAAAVRSALRGRSSERQAPDPLMTAARGTIRALDAMWRTIPGDDPRSAVELALAMGVALRAACAVLPDDEVEPTLELAETWFREARRVS